MEMSSLFSVFSYPGIHPRILQVIFRARNQHPAPRKQRPAPRNQHPAPSKQRPAPRTPHPAPRTPHPALRISGKLGDCNMQVNAARL